MQNSDSRQRFFIQNSPVRGDVVRLTNSYANIISQKDYPESIKRLLGEMLVSASLLMSSIKIEGSLSIQLQSNTGGLLRWAMAECDHQGNVRGLADWISETDDSFEFWNTHMTADDAFAQLGVQGETGSGVLFISIKPKDGKSYQGIVDRNYNSLAECLTHYQKQSAQIPTLVNLSCDGLQAGGLLLQMLPLTIEEKSSMEQDESLGIDDDLWTRLTALTNTVKGHELTKLSSHELIYRLYNEEEVVMPDSFELRFGCTCSQEKSQSAIMQLGKEQAFKLIEDNGGRIDLDCGFCGRVYLFDSFDVENFFAE